MATPNPNKRLNTEVDVSPMGTFSLSDIGSLMDRKLDPIVEKLEVVQRALDLEDKVKKLEIENKRLRERLVRQESYSRRENIKVLGIEEKSNEDCEQELLMLLKQFYPHFDDRTFTIVHRVGKKYKDTNRTMIARFHHLKDKFMLQKCSHDIYKKSKVSILDDFPQEVVSARKALLPILRTAKSLPEFNSGGPRPKLQDDKLCINGVCYGISNLSQLPKQLRPENVSTPTQNGLTAFYSKNSPLSNHYPVKFKVTGEAYSCMEQFFMIAKATEFGDQNTVMKIKAETDPVKIKKTGQNSEKLQQQALAECSRGKDLARTYS